MLRPYRASGGAVRALSTLPALFEPTAARAGAPVRTASCVIIGDEVLNGKTRDSNSHAMARHCFALGIDLKRACAAHEA